MQIISAHLISEFGLRIYRVSVGEAERFPALAREYYESGLLLLRHQLGSYLQRCVQREELSIPDMELAAEQLIQLSGVSIHTRALFLGPDAVDKEHVRKVGAGAVQMFLACYGKRRPPVDAMH